MDPAFLDVTLGVIANAMTSLLARFGLLLKTGLVGHELADKLKQNELLADPSLRKAIEEVSEAIGPVDPLSMEETCIFVASPEVEAILRHVFLLHLSHSVAEGLELAREKFVSLLVLYCGGNANIEAADHLFHRLVRSCELALKVAVTKGLLSAHEALATLRHRVLIDELAGLKRSIGFLKGSKMPDLTEIRQFEEKYRRQVAQRHAYITPPHFDTALKLPIEDIYVTPNVLPLAGRSRKRGRRQRLDTQRLHTEASHIPMDAFLFTVRRAVLLGNPGGGKSTLANKLCYDLCRHYERRILAGSLLTPLLVVLREYGAEKKIRKCSILEFLELVANSTYQVSPPKGAIEYMLTTGRAAVIFDGLDELLDTAYRQDVSADVESFCSLYPLAPTLITSREVGYDQAPLAEDKFALFALASFNPPQIEEYATKWFAVDTELTEEQRKQKVDKFLRESEIVPDLRSNPLMLALICNIYRGENYIPRNRPDVYKKCAIMLFERWDKSRNIHVTLPIETHVNPTMKFLAHWIYSEPRLQAGVTEDSLTDKAVEYLCPRRFEHREDADVAAREFIHFCRGRAWVFTDTGTTRDGRSLYQFTHRTFLEYFTAAYLVRTHPTASDLLKYLLPKIARREWDVVAQLAFQLQNENVEGAGDELLEGVLSGTRTAVPEEIWNLLSFATRCLEFMVPSPKVTRRVTSMALARLLQLDDMPVRRVGGYGNDAEYEVLDGLMSAGSENRLIIADTIKLALDDRIKHGRDRQARAALSLALGLGPVPRFHPDDVSAFWLTVSAAILEEAGGRVSGLLSGSADLSLQFYFANRMQLSTLIELHGIESLFRHAKAVPNRLFLSVAERQLELSLASDEAGLRGLAEVVLRQIGAILRARPLPWFRKSALPKPDEFIVLYRHDLPAEISVPGVLEDADTMLGLFAMAAVVVELQLPGGAADLLAAFSEMVSPMAPWLALVLRGRLDRKVRDEAQAEIRRTAFPVRDQKLVSDWVRGKVNLVQEIEPSTG